MKTVTLTPTWQFAVNALRLFVEQKNLYGVATMTLELSKLGPEATENVLAFLDDKVTRAANDKGLMKLLSIAMNQDRENQTNENTA